MTTFLSGLDRVSPTLAAAASYSAYLSAGRRRPVKPRERVTHNAARRSTIVVDGKRVVVYEWGSGQQAVLLVHGWRGRASQFAAIVRELRFEGYRVVAFDAPSCGDSPGRSTHVGEFRQIVDTLARREPNGFAAIVSHSAGALAAIAAAADDGITERIVAIAPIVRFRYLGEKFATLAGIGERARMLQEAWTSARLRRMGFELHDRYDLLTRDLPAHLSVTIVHDRDDKMSDISESRAFAARHPHNTTLTETSGSGHARILETDAALDAAVVSCLALSATVVLETA